MPTPHSFSRHASLAALMLLCGTALAQSPGSKPSSPGSAPPRGVLQAIGGSSNFGREGAPPALAFGGAFSGSPGGPFGSELPSIAGAPFSAVGTTENVTKLLDGNQIVQTNTARFWRDGQGRTRVERGFPRMPKNFRGGEFPSMATIWDPTTNQGFMLNASSRTATEMGSYTGSPSVTKGPVTAPPITAHLSTGCASFGFIGVGAFSQGKSKITELGERDIDGIRVTGTRMEYTVAADEIGNVKPIIIVTEQWFSPDLGMVIESSQKSPTGSESSYKLTQIQREEQDRALFTVPTDYTKQDMETRGFSTIGIQPLQRIEKAP